MAKKSAPINLVKRDSNNTVNQIVNWALTIGRVLIIIVEIIALSALIYRFILDAQLRDISSKINQEQAILSSQAKNEATFRNLQDRLALEATIINQGQGEVKVFKDIVSFAPVGMTFTNITSSTNGITISANVSSVFPLSVFINSLKNYPKVDSISIDKIENKTTSAIITVGISVYLKGGTNANSGN
jgi:hypothetical protein